MFNISSAKISDCVGGKHDLLMQLLLLFILFKCAVCLQLTAELWQFCVSCEDLLLWHTHHILNCICHDVWVRWVIDYLLNMLIGEFHYLCNLRSYSDRGMFICYCFAIFLCWLLSVFFTFFNHFCECLCFTVVWINLSVNWMSHMICLKHSLTGNTLVSIMLRKFVEISEIGKMSATLTELWV